MAKMKERIAIAILAFSGCEAENRAVPPEEGEALYREMQQGAEAGDEEAIRTLKAMHGLVDAALDAMLAMSDEVGMAIRETWDNFGDDPTMGPVEVEALWQAGIEAAKK